MTPIRAFTVLLLIAGCSHSTARPQKKDLAVRIDAPESPLLRHFTSTLIRHGVRVIGEPQADALDLTLRYDAGPEPTPSNVLPRDGQFTLEVRSNGKLLQTLVSPDQFCLLRKVSLREFYGCHADRLSYDFLASDATRKLPVGRPAPPPDGGS